MNFENLNLMALFAWWVTYDFRSNHSTELVALHVVDEVIKYLDRNDVPIHLFRHI